MMTSDDASDPPSLTKETTTADAPKEEAEHHSYPFFDFMARHPVPFLIVIPVVFAFLLGFGWTVEDKVEDEVAKIWIAQDGNYAKDQDYAASFNSDDLTSTSFDAMAISRDGGNILTASRLEEIRTRMEESESVKVRILIHSCILRTVVFFTPIQHSHTRIFKL